MTDERTIKAALEREARQMKLPPDQLTRIERQADAPARPGLWVRVEVVAAVLILAVMLGLAGWRAWSTAPSTFVQEPPTVPVVPEGPEPGPPPSTECLSAPLTAGDKASEVSLFFTCSGDSFDAPPRAVTRPVSFGGDPIRTALEELLKGPTGDEQARGFASFFHAGSAGMLKSVTVTDEGRAIVDFADIRQPLNNASTSAGSKQFLQELGQTLFQFAAVKEAEFRIEGSCDGFWQWLQSSCQVITAERYRADVTQGTGRQVIGCDATPTQKALFARADLRSIPWIHATPADAGITGHLFASPDGVATTYVGPGRPDGASNKVLWLVSHPGAGSELAVSGTNMTTGETYHEVFPSSAAGEFPSIIALPAPGCWKLELTTGAVTGRAVFAALREIDFALQVRVAGREPTLGPIAGARVSMKEIGLSQVTDGRGMAGPMTVPLSSIERFPYDLEVSADGYKTCVIQFGSMVFPGTGRWWEESPYFLFVYLPEGEGTVGSDGCYGGRTQPQTPGP
ncbi:MAG TPA: GerMN domain-containing protein [Symbiobacteriaceae bacterium]|nr:GerMN domain-containing protein [Symbiobacteriaceae bacterium]